MRLPVYHWQNYPKGITPTVFFSSRKLLAAAILLRMTNGEKRSGKLWGGTGSDWYLVRTMKRLLTGQSVRAKNMNVYNAYGWKLARKRKSSRIESMALQNSLQSHSHERNPKNTV